jgi:hypothetical protein
LTLQYLIASGHSLTNIFLERQKGLPYCGWTLPQYRYWSEIIICYMKKRKAENMENITNAIDGCNSKAGRKKLQKKLDELNA